MLIVGLSGSGKSTIISQLKGLPESTCEEELGIDSFVINESVRFIVFEVAGRAISTWHNYYATSNIVVFVVDATEPESYPKVADIL
jgi:GTPase SAR1 family protein